MIAIPRRKRKKRLMLAANPERLLRFPSVRPDDGALVPVSEPQAPAATSVTA